jgi:hypothetical protein
LWHPEIVPDCSDVWISQDSSYSKVLTEADLERCESSNSIYNFIHMTLVGANNGSTNLDGEPLSDKNGIFEDVFWDHNVSPEIANEKLMKTMAMFKLYIFKEMTKKINSRIYKAANNTPLSTEFFPGLNFTSQPVLPLIINDDDQYNMGMINIPDTDISIPAGILMTICPMIQAQIGVEIPPEYNWANGSETGQQVSYFTDDQILRARAILQWISSEWEVGYSNATLSGLEEDTDDDELSLALNRDFNYDANLVTTSTNFPLIYEQLGATYSTTAKFQDYQLVLLWTTFAIVLTMIAFTVYIRTDFK